MHGEGRTGARRQLLLDVGDHPGVGGRRRGQHGYAVRKALQQFADAPVVRPEVMPPVTHAVGLVDDEQAAAPEQVGQLLVAEGGVVESLGAHQQDVGFVGHQGRPHLRPVKRVGRVHGHRVYAGSLGCRDLVAHER